MTGPVLVLLLGFIGGRTRAVTERRFAEVRWLGAFFLDMLSGLATLKMFGRSAEQVGNIRTISRQYGETTMEVLRTAFQTSLVLEWGAAVAVALVAVEISLRLMAGGIAFDRALAVLIIVPEFFLPLRNLATRYHSGAAGRTVAARAFAILDEPMPRRPTPDRVVHAVPADADVRFAGVTLTYPTRLDPALRDLDLTIRHGRLTALVGETGAGKTTVASLLLRFIEPTAGEILVGDVPLAAIDLSAWRAAVAWVPQAPYLFHGTVADNLRLARPDARRRRGPGGRPGSRRRRLHHGSPARLRHPGRGGWRPTERRSAAADRDRPGDPRRRPDRHPRRGHLAPRHRERDGHPRRRRPTRAGARTVLVVSHRLRLAAVADEVVVLGGGRVLEAGPPADLAARDGAYRRLLDVRRADLEAEA